MSASTTDDVIVRLDDIIRRAIVDGDRRGYFPALYNRVTRRVRDEIQRGGFDDGARMERFDVIFANRYLDAYDTYARGERPTRAWTRAFDAAASDRLLVIQHLLLGMNAHITLDLGVAAAEAAPGPAIEGLRVDFFRINAILASLVGTVEDELVAIAGAWRPDLGGLLRGVERAAGGVDRTAASLLMDGARDLAWAFANRLARADDGARAALIAEQDAEATLLADAVLVESPLVALLAVAGPSDVREDLRLLAQGEGGI
jgi:hypothetical protein